MRAEDWSTRALAAGGVGSAGRATAGVIAALEAAAVDPRGASPACRLGAISALLAVGVSRVRLADLLSAGLRHESPNVRESSEEGIRKLGL